LVGINSDDTAFHAAQQVLIVLQFPVFKWQKEQQEQENPEADTCNEP